MNFDFEHSVKNSSSHNHIFPGGGLLKYNYFSRSIGRFQQFLFRLSQIWPIFSKLESLTGFPDIQSSLRWNGSIYFPCTRLLLCVPYLGEYLWTLWLDMEMVNLSNIFFSRTLIYNVYFKKQISFISIEINFCWTFKKFAFTAAEKDVNYWYLYTGKLS